MAYDYSKQHIFGPGMGGPQGGGQQQQLMQAQQQAAQMAQSQGGGLLDPSTALSLGKKGFDLYEQFTGGGGSGSGAGGIANASKGIFGDSAGGGLMESGITKGAGALGGSSAASGAASGMSGGVAGMAGTGGEMVAGALGANEDEAKLGGLASAVGTGAAMGGPWGAAAGGAAYLGSQLLGGIF